jgi:hypothetical protein
MTLSNVLTIANDHTNSHGEVSLPTDALDRALQAANTKLCKTRNTKKPKKDPNAPKRPCNPYVRWLNENRSAIRDELKSTNPDAKITDVSKKAGELWTSLSDDEKNPFVEAAKAEYANYHTAMKHYKPDYTIPGAKKPKVVYDTYETPDAPLGWTGPHDMKYIKGNVKSFDGKSIRPIKNWDFAVQAVIEVNQAWTTAKSDGTIPSHWNNTTPPCAGITKTSTGYHPRAGAIQALIDTPETKRSGGIASWLLTPLPVIESVAEHVNEHVIESVAEVEAEHVIESVAEVEAEHVIESVAEHVIEHVIESVAEVEAKPKKTLLKSKKTKPVAVNLDDCDEIETERDGKDFSCYRHIHTNKLYIADDLIRPIGAIVNVIDDNTGQPAIDEDGDPEQDIVWS